MPDIGFLVEGEHHCPGRRFHIHANDIDQLLLEPGVVGHLERVDLPRLEVVIGPDLGDVSLPMPSRAASDRVDQWVAPPAGRSR